MTPAFPRGVRLKHDRVRDTQVLLGPERALMLDAVGHAILSEVNGKADINLISARLAARFEAPEDVIRKDVEEFLSELSDKRLIDMGAA